MSCSILCCSSNPLSHNLCFSHSPKHLTCRFILSFHSSTFKLPLTYLHKHQPKIHSTDVPVAEGSPETLKGGIPRVADFVHGSDGLGNTFMPPPKTTKSDKSRPEFLVDKVSEFPGEVSILALGPLTNLALAVKRDPSFASKIKRLVVLGGAFFALGNVNPAAEANVCGLLFY